MTLSLVSKGRSKPLRPRRAIPIQEPVSKPVPPKPSTSQQCGGGTDFFTSVRDIQDRASAPKPRHASKALSVDLVSLLSTSGWRLLVVQSIEIGFLSSVDDSLHSVTSYASISQVRKALGCTTLMYTYICGRRSRRLAIYMFRLF